MRIPFLPCIVLLAIVVNGCGAGDPVVPVTQNSSIHQSETRSNRYLWGIWKIHIDENFESVTVVRDRVAEMHLNCVRLLEVTPCTNCLSIANLQLLPDNVIQGDLVLKHPYSTGNLKLSGFDVRGIFIGEADYTWPVSGRKQAVGDDVPRMLNPDGYTSLFNPTEFPQTSPPALGYIVGNYTFGGDLTATLNPYIAFKKDQPRRLFTFGQTGTETIRIKFPEGPLEFGYAIDGCWQTFPGPCIDPVVDFPPDANCLEAYQVTTWAGPGLSLDPGAWSYVYATVYDHQGEDTIAQVTAEIPEVVSGPIIMDFYDDRADGGFVYRGKVTNELDAPTGDYPFLVRVIDTVSDQNLGQIDAWSPGIFPIRNGWVMFWGAETNYLNSYAFDIETDIDGEIYALGRGNYSVDLDPSPGENIQGYYEVPYISKYDWGGGLVWADSWNGDINPYAGGDIALDDEGNIYLVGDFGRTVDFDPTPGVEERTSYFYTDDNGHDYWIVNMFLLKLNPDGELIWVLTWFGLASIKPVTMEMVGSSIYIAGNFWGTADFDPGAGVDEYTKDEEDLDAFLIKLDTDGNYLWADVITCDNWIHARDIGVDLSGNVILSGLFRGVADMDPGQGEDIHDSQNLDNCYCSKFTSDGDFLWSNSITAVSLANPARSPAVAVDSDNFIYVVYAFSNVVDFDPGTYMDVHVSNGMSDAFMTKYDPAGNYQWVVTWGGSSDEHCDSIEIDRFDNIYVLGRYRDLVDFDPGPGEELHQPDYYHGGYLSRFDTSGFFQWVAVWDDDMGNSLATDFNGNIYLTDHIDHWFTYSGQLVDFDPGPGTRFMDAENLNGCNILKMPYGFNWW